MIFLLTACILRPILGVIFSTEFGMKSKQATIVSLVIAVCLQFIGISLQAQSGDKFKTRLSPVPALGIPPASVAGVGAASPPLAGRGLYGSGATLKKGAAAAVAPASPAA